jgi:hypothetical protein
VLPLNLPDSLPLNLPDSLPPSLLLKLLPLLNLLIPLTLVSAFHLLLDMVNMITIPLLLIELTSLK